MKLNLLRNKLVVCDTPCLLYLGRIGRLELLHALFQRVAVPSQVALELDMGRFWRADTADPRKLEWVRLVEVSPAEIEKAPVKRVTLPDCPAPASRELEAAYYPTSEAICTVIRELLAKDQA